MRGTTMIEVKLLLKIMDGAEDVESRPATVSGCQVVLPLLAR